MKKAILFLSIASVVCILGFAFANSYDFRGNKNTHKYHYKTCKFFNRLTNKEDFATAREAEQAGYRPCGLCRPDLVKNEIPQTGKIMLATSTEKTNVNK